MLVFSLSCCMCGLRVPRQAAVVVSREREHCCCVLLMVVHRRHLLASVVELVGMLF